ncbi:MAG: DUF4384 domain-containing protein [Candidatus Sumerlaeia bacterium]
MDMQIIRRKVSAGGLLCLLPLMLFLGACASSQTASPGDSPEITGAETLLERSAESRPSWTITPPEASDGMMYFVGISAKHATEQAAREEAMRYARMEFANFTGVEIQEIQKELEVSFGAAGQIEDPTLSNIRRMKQQVNAKISGMKAREGYFERYGVVQGEREYTKYWQYWVLASVKESEIENVRKWVEEQREKARSMQNAAIASSRELQEGIDVELSRSQPLAAMAKVKQTWKNLIESGQRMSEYGWPYNKPEYKEPILNEIAQVRSRARDVLNTIMIDTGRYSGQVYVPANRFESSVPVWVLCFHDNRVQPVADMPLVLREEASQRVVARSTSDIKGQALFDVPNIKPGAYVVKVDENARAISSLGQDVASLMETKENTLSVTVADQTIPASVLVAVRQLFQGPATMDPPAQKVFLGPVTYENLEHKDTRQGSKFSYLVKAEMRNQVARIQDIVVVDQRERSRSVMEQTQKQLSRGNLVVPKMQSATAQAVIDGAEAAIKTQYAVYGGDVKLSVQLLKAGTEDVILASALITIPASAIPPGLGIIPTLLDTYEEFSETGSGKPIQIEVTSQRGDGEIYEEGEKIVYFFSTNRDAHILLIYEDADRNLLQVLPNRFSGNNRYPAGEFFKIPADDARFEFMITKPFGTERLWAFAASKPFPELAGQDYDFGRVLNEDMETILNVLRRHGLRPDVAYGEAQTILTTVEKK